MNTVIPSLSPVEKLRAFAQQKGLSQEALAETLGCAQPHVSRILRGKKRVGLKLATSIERATSGAIKAVDWADDVPGGA